MKITQSIIFKKKKQLKEGMFLKLFKGREILLAAVVNSNLHLAIYINLGVCYFFAFFLGGGGHL